MTTGAEKPCVPGQSQVARAPSDPAVEDQCLVRDQATPSSPDRRQRGNQDPLLGRVALRIEAEELIVAVIGSADDVAVRTDWVWLASPFP
jgi:hypothetical protein